MKKITAGETTRRQTHISLGKQGHYPGKTDSLRREAGSFCLNNGHYTRSAQVCQAFFRPLRPPSLSGAENCT